MRHLPILLSLSALLWGGCSRSGGGTKIHSEADSVAYVIGLNVAANLMRMDSTIHVEAVCRGIADYFAGRPMMTLEEAQSYYLRYVNYAIPEQIREQERQFLDDVTADRNFKRSDSGVRYSITTEGDLSRMVKSDRDSIAIRLKLLRRNGDELYSSYERGDTLRTHPDSLPVGLREGVKFVGRGGAVKLWVPADRAYGATGNSDLGLGANETLYFEVELLDVVPAESQKR